MNNLNELGLVEMQQEEMIQLEGGIIPLVAYCIFAEVLTAGALGLTI
jgi:hypothetical protein